MDPIVELGQKLKAAKVDIDSAVIVSLLVREGDRREQLMAWMEENPRRPRRRSAKRQEPCMDRNRARRAAMRSSSLYTEVHGGVVNQQA